MTPDSPRILLVDDDPTNRDVFAEVLREEPYDLVQADSGQEAMKIIRESAKSFDVIVLDRIMPDMNGLEVMGKLKADIHWKWIPVIMATAAGTPREICEGMEAGVFFYLIKPFDAQTLLRIVRIAVEEREKWHGIQESLASPAKSLQFLQTGEFHIRDMDQAYALAIFLAQSCPEPDKVAFGLNELLCNAVEHGNLGIGFDEKSNLQAENEWEAEIKRRLDLPQNAGKVVKIRVDRQPETLTITITDQGNGFDWKLYEMIQPDRLLESHGRGIAMAKAMSFDRLEYQGPGNQVVCTVELKRVGRSQSEALTASAAGNSR